MKPLRAVVFWIHLAAGAAAGIVILVMSVTGIALTYEKQVIEWADRRAWTAPSTADARPLPPEALLAKVTAARPGVAPAGITMRARADAPATITLAGNTLLLVDPYSGAIIGAPPAGLRSFFRTMTAWHRYLALDGASRSTGRMMTGAANLVFLLLAVSGVYLWLPRVWSWIQFKNVMWFRRGTSGKARDFNWHNTIGFWSAVPLVVIVAGAVPISYSWASDLVYRITGEVPPPRNPAARAPQASAKASTSAKATADKTAGKQALEPSSPPVLDTSGLNAAWAHAERQVPGWRTISTRAAASPAAPIVVTVDEGHAGQPQKRITLTVDRATAELVKAERFDNLSAGRRARSWLRFAHTGEFYGLAGQTIVGIASAGGATLVYTGLALALRRVRSWIARRRAGSSIEQRRAA